MNPDHYRFTDENRPYPFDRNLKNNIGNARNPVKKTAVSTGLMGYLTIFKVEKPDF